MRSKNGMDGFSLNALMRKMHESCWVQKIRRRGRDKLELIKKVYGSVYTKLRTDNLTESGKRNVWGEMFGRHCQSNAATAAHRLHWADKLKLRIADRAGTRRRSIAVGMSLLPLTGLMRKDPQESIRWLILHVAHIHGYDYAYTADAGEGRKLLVKAADRHRGDVLVVAKDLDVPTSSKEVPVIVGAAGSAPPAAGGR